MENGFTLIDMIFQHIEISKIGTVSSVSRHIFCDMVFNFHLICELLDYSRRKKFLMK